MTIMTPKAADIINTNPYWKDEKAISISAVNFGKEAPRLAGPFDEHFGLVYIHHDEHSLPMATQIENSIETSSTHTLYMPRHIKDKVETVFGDSSKLWFNKNTRKCISDLDIKCGEEHEGFSATDTNCGIFFNTQKAQKKIKSILTEDEIKEWNDNISQAVQSWKYDMDETQTCAEKPFIVRVQGTDDCSYSKTFSTYEECLDCLTNLHKNGFETVDSMMTFTN
jgi:hypothetical protein